MALIFTVAGAVLVRAPGKWVASESINATKVLSMMTYGIFRTFGSE